MKRVHAILYFGFFLCALNVVHIPKPKSENIIAESYLGPKEFNHNSSELIRVELLVKDSPKLSGLQIKNVSFNGEEVPLKPRDIFGKRATASFQLPPGKYTLRWTVNRDSLIWPRTIKHKEEVMLDQRDLWVQIQINGDQATIR